MTTRTALLFAAAAFCGGYLMRQFAAPGATAQAQSQHVFELRTYTTAPGRLDALNARFRNHTMKIFENHGMKNIGYWIPTDEARSKDTLIYILQHDSLDAAKKSWDAFGADPEWKKVQSESEASGKIVTKVDHVFMTPTDYSQIK